MDYKHWRIGQHQEHYDTMFYRLHTGGNGRAKIRLLVGNYYSALRYFDHMKALRIALYCSLNLLLVIKHFTKYIQSCAQNRAKFSRDHFSTRVD